jgi:hypothetical protein
MDPIHEPQNSVQESILKVFSAYKSDMIMQPKTNKFFVSRCCHNLPRKMKLSTEEEKQISDTRDALNSKEDNSANEVQIMHFNFLLNIFGLLPPKNATPFVRFLYKVFIVGIISLYLLTVVGQLTAIFLHWGDIPLLASTMCITSGLILTSISCGYFLRKKNTFMRLIDVLKMELIAEMRSKYSRFTQQAERQIKIFVFITVQITLACVGIWTFAAYLNQDDVNNMGNNNITAGEYGVERMVYVIWVPFDIYKSPQFQIISVLQIIVGSLAGSTLLAVDTVFLSLMAHAAAQFKVLSETLNDMHENIAESEFHRTEERASPVHVSTNDSSVKETLTSARGNIPHEYPSGSEEHYGSPSSGTAHPGDGRAQEDPFQLYLVECIKYHQAIIE